MYELIYKLIYERLVYECVNAAQDIFSEMKNLFESKFTTFL